MLTFIVTILRKMLILAGKIVSSVQLVLNSGELFGQRVVRGNTFVSHDDGSSPNQDRRRRLIAPRSDELSLFLEFVNRRHQWSVAFLPWALLYWSSLFGALLPFTSLPRPATSSSLLASIPNPPSTQHSTNTMTMKITFSTPTTITKWNKCLSAGRSVIGVKLYLTAIASFKIKKKTCSISFYEILLMVEIHSF